MIAFNYFLLVLASTLIFFVVTLKLLFAKSQTKIDWSGHLDKLIGGWTSREFQGFVFLSALILYVVLNGMTQVEYFMNIWLIAFGVYAGSRTILKYTEAKKNV